MIPLPVQKMMMVPGVYLISPDDDRTFSVVIVNARGQVVQMKPDGVLLPGKWAPGVIVRGPLPLDAKPIEP